MPTPPASHASPKWASVVDRLNDFYRARRSAPAATAPAAEVAAALREDPVGVFLANPFVAWARWQDPVRDTNRIATLLNVANGRSTASRDALTLACGSKIVVSTEGKLPMPTSIGRDLWRSRLRRIASAQNDKARAQVASALAPELVKEVADNAVFVVDHTSRINLRFRMLERFGSTASLSYATLLLLGADGPGRRLCECQLSGCGVFYFAKLSSGPGRKKTRYCTEEHRIGGEKEVNRKASREWRKKKKIDESTRASRRSKK